MKTNFIQAIKMHQEIINHLSSRPFAPILQHQLLYGENTIALKLMCVVDYFLEIKQLYPEISIHPKLLVQLLRFKDYERFHYFEYKLPDFPFGDWTLVCQCCEFTAPYKYTHMVLCHDRHLSAELCHWSGQHELRDHTQSDTLSQCYQSYFYKKIGSYAGTHLSVLIKNVFTQIRLLAAKLGVKTYRYTRYRAIKSTAKELLATGGIDDADIFKEIYVTKTQKRVWKSMKHDQLEALFQKAMKHFGITVGDVQHLPFDRADAGGTAPESYATGRDVHTVPMMQSSAPLSDTQQIPQFPEIQMMPSPPLSTTSYQLAASSTATYNAQLQIMNLAGFLTSALLNIRNESIRKKAVINIQQSILQFANEDLQSQIDGASND